MKSKHKKIKEGFILKVNPLIKPKPKKDKKKWQI